MLLSSYQGQTPNSHRVCFHRRSRDSELQLGPGPCPLAQAGVSHLKFIVGDAEEILKHQGPFRVPAIVTNNNKKKILTL